MVSRLVYRYPGRTRGTGSAANRQYFVRLIVKDDK